MGQLIEVMIRKFTELGTEHMFSNILDGVRFQFKLLFTYPVKINVNSSF